MLQKRNDVKLWHTLPPKENPSDLSHPFHSIFLAFVESTQQCIASIQSSGQHTTICHQLEESGFTFLFYHTLIKQTSESVEIYRKEKGEQMKTQSNVGDVNQLSVLIDYLQKGRFINKVEKYDDPIKLTYDDLCKQCSNISSSSH